MFRSILSVSALVLLVSNSVTVLAAPTNTSVTIIEEAVEEAGSGLFPELWKRDGHKLVLENKCNHAVKPRIANTRCGYSPRCGDASAYNGQQPGELPAGKTHTAHIPRKWVGRVFADIDKCGPKGEQCSLTEWNLDTGDQFTPQSYDISNIQGFTQSFKVSMPGCKSATCKSKNCKCNQAYPVGNTNGCGNVVDKPVRGCGAGDKTMHVTFCPN